MISTWRLRWQNDVQTGVYYLQGISKLCREQKSSTSKDSNANAPKSCQDIDPTCIVSLRQLRRLTIDIDQASTNVIKFSSPSPHATVMEAGSKRKATDAGGGNGDKRAKVCIFRIFHGRDQ